MRVKLILQRTNFPETRANYSGCEGASLISCRRSKERYKNLRPVRNRNSLMLLALSLHEEIVCAKYNVEQCNCENGGYFGQSSQCQK